MYLKNETNSLVIVAGLPIAPGRVGEIDDHRYAEWRSASPANRRMLASLVEVSEEESGHVPPTIFDAPEL